MGEAEPLLAADAACEWMTGHESWFDPPPGTTLPQRSPLIARFIYPSTRTI